MKIPKINISILDVLNVVRSYKTAFILAILGVISQWYHIYQLTYEISNLEGNNRVIQAALMSIFLTGALLYFTLKAGTVVIHEKDNKAEQTLNIQLRDKYSNAIIWFASFDTWVNITYWMKTLIVKEVYIDKVWNFTLLGHVDWFKVILALIFSVMLPQTLKLYGGETRHTDNKHDTTLALHDIEAEVGLLKDIADSLQTKMKEPIDATIQLKEENNKRKTPIDATITIK